MSYENAKLMNLEDGQLLLSVLDKRKADIISVSDTTPEAVKTFPDGANGMPMGLTVGIEPVQDLHGQENPWPAGGGKNKCIPYSDRTSHVGITYTVTSDGVSVAGTATGGSYSYGSTYAYEDSPIKLPAGEYTFSSSEVPGTSQVQGYLVFMGTTESGTAISNIILAGTTLSRSVTFSEPVGISYGFYVASGQTVNKDCKIMIEAGSTKTDFAPYSNVCPISGWTGAEVTRTGKNLINVDSADNIGAYISNNGGINTNSQWTTSYLIPVDSNKAYSLSGLTSHPNTGTDHFRTYDSNRQYIGVVSVSSPDGFPKQFNSDVAFVQFCWKNSDKASVQFEEGSASAYEAFGNTYQITFPSEAGTVYGGSLTVNQDGSGTLVVDRIGVDMGDLNWASWSESGSLLFNVSLPGKTYNRTIPDCISSMYKYKSEVSLWSQLLNGEMTGNPTNDRIYVRNSAYASNEAFKAGMSGEQIVYTLANPITYILSALDVIETLKGNNVLFADTGDIKSVDYPADTKLYIDGKIAELQALILENISNS